MSSAENFTQPAEGYLVSTVILLLRIYHYNCICTIDMLHYTCKYGATIVILSIGTDRPEQTV